VTSGVGAGSDRVLSHDGLPVVVTFGAQQGLHSLGSHFGFFYDFSLIRSFFKISSFPSSGSRILLFMGSSFGVFHTSPRSSVGFLRNSVSKFSGSSGEYTGWASSSAISFKYTAGHGGRVGFGVNSGLPVSVTFGLQQGSSNQSFFFGASILSYFSKQNLPSTGGRIIFCRGSNSGRTSSSAAVNVGPSSCRSTTWLSDSLLNCRTPSGFGSFQSASLSFSNQVTTLAAAFSFDITFIPTSPPEPVSNLTLVKNGYPSSIVIQWNLNFVLIQLHQVTEIAILLFPFSRILEPSELSGNTALIDHASYSPDCFVRIPPTTVLFKAPDSSTHCSKSLEPGSLKYVVVFTVNAIGKTAMPMVVQVTKLPEAPVIFNSSITGSFEASITWGTPDLGFSELIEYIIEYSFSNDSSITSLNVSNLALLVKSKLRYLKFISTNSRGRFLAFSIKTCTAVGCSDRSDIKSLEFLTYPLWINTLTSQTMSAGINCSFQTSNTEAPEMTYTLLISASHSFFPFTSYALEFFQPTITIKYEKMEKEIRFFVPFTTLEPGMKYFFDIESCNPVGCTNAKSSGTQTKTHVVDMSPKLSVTSISPSFLYLNSGATVTVIGFFKYNGSISAFLNNGIASMTCQTTAYYYDQAYVAIVNVSQWKYEGEPQLILKLEDEEASGLVEFHKPLNLVITAVSAARGPIQGGKKIIVHISNAMAKLSTEDISTLFGTVVGEVVDVQYAGLGTHIISILAPAVTFLNDTTVIVKIIVKEKEVPSLSFVFLYSRVEILNFEPTIIFMNAASFEISFVISNVQKLLISHYLFGSAELQNFVVSQIGTNAFRVAVRAPMSTPGDYIIKLTVNEGQETIAGTVRVLPFAPMSVLSVKPTWAYFELATRFTLRAVNIPNTIKVMCDADDASQLKSRFDGLVTELTFMCAFRHMGQNIIYVASLEHVYNISTKVDVVANHSSKIIGIFPSSFARRGTQLSVVSVRNAQHIRNSAFSAAITSIDIAAWAGLYTKIQCNGSTVAFGVPLALLRFGQDPIPQLKSINLTFYSQSAFELVLSASRHESAIETDHYFVFLHTLSDSIQLCPDTVIQLILADNTSDWMDASSSSIDALTDQLPEIFFVDPFVFHGSVSDAVFRVSCRYFFGINSSSIVEVRVGNRTGMVTNVQYAYPDAFDATVKFEPAIMPSGYISISLSVRTGIHYSVAPAANIQVLRQMQLKIIRINASKVYQNSNPRSVEVAFEYLADSQIAVICGVVKIEPFLVIVNSNIVTFSLPINLKVGDLPCSLMTSSQSITISLTVIRDPISSAHCTKQSHISSGFQGGTIATLQFEYFQKLTYTSKLFANYFHLNKTTECIMNISTFETTVLQCITPSSFTAGTVMANITSNEFGGSLGVFCVTYFNTTAVQLVSFNPQFAFLNFTNTITIEMKNAFITDSKQIQVLQIEGINISVGNNLDVSDGMLSFLQIIARISPYYACIDNKIEICIFVIGVEIRMQLSCINWDSFKIRSFFPTSFVSSSVNQFHVYFFATLRAEPENLQVQIGDLVFNSTSVSQASVFSHLTVYIANFYIKMPFLSQKRIVNVSWIYLNAPHNLIGTVQVIPCMAPLFLFMLPSKISAFRPQNIFMRIMIAEGLDMEKLLVTSNVSTIKFNCSIVSNHLNVRFWLESMRPQVLLIEIFDLQSQDLIFQITRAIEDAPSPSLQVLKPTIIVHNAFGIETVTVLVPSIYDYSLFQRCSCGFLWHPAKGNFKQIFGMCVSVQNSSAGLVIQIRGKLLEEPGSLGVFVHSEFLKLASQDSAISVVSPASPKILRIDPPFLFHLSAGYLMVEIYDLDGIFSHSNIEVVVRSKTGQIVLLNVESLLSKTGTSLFKFRAPEEFDESFLSALNTLTIVTPSFSSASASIMFEIKRRKPEMTYLYQSISAIQGNESTLDLGIKYFPKLNSVADVIPYFVPEANILEILHISSSKFSSSDYQMSMRVQWLTEGIHTMNLLTIAGQDSIQTRLMVYSDSPKIVYVVPTIGFSTSSSTFTLGVKGISHDNFLIIVDAKTTPHSSKITKVDGISEISFEFSNASFVGMLNVTLEVLGSTPHINSSVSSVFPLILPAKAAITKISPSVCSILGNSRITLSLANFNTSLGAPRIKIEMGSKVDIYEPSAQISVTCSESKNADIVQPRVSQGPSAVAYGLLEYTLGCNDYFAFCKTMGVLPNVSIMASISNLDPCDASHCIAVIDFPNITVISSTQESYVGEYLTVQLENLYAHSLNDIVIQNDNHFFVVSFFGSEKEFSTIKFLASTPTMMTNTFKIFSVQTGNQIFAEFSINVYKIPFGTVLTKQVAPENSTIYENSNIVIIEFSNFPYVSEWKSETFRPRESHLMECIENPKLIHSSKNGSTVVSFMFSPFKCLHSDTSNHTVLEVAVSISTIHSTFFLMINPPAPLNIKYIDPAAIIVTGKPMTLSIVYDGCICLLPWCKKFQNLTLMGKSQIFEFVPNTFGPIFASAVVLKDKSFTATYVIPADVEADKYILTTANGKCLTSTSYEIHKKLIDPSISRILPRNVSMLGGEIVTMYVDNAVGEHNFILFVQSVQVDSVVLKSDLLKGQFVLQFHSPPSETLGAAYVELKLLDSRRKVSSTSQLFYEPPPLKLEPDVLLLGDPNEINVTLLHPRSKIFAKFRLICSRYEGFFLHIKLLDLAIQGFNYIRITFLIHVFNAGRQECMLFSSEGFSWPVRFVVFAKPTLVSVSDWQFNKSSTHSCLINMVVANFPFDGSRKELAVDSAENSSLAFSFQNLPNNRLAIDAYIPYTPHIILRHAFLPRFLLKVIINNNHQFPMKVKILKQNYISHVNQNSAHLEILVLVENCNVDIISEIEATSMFSNIIVSSITTGFNNAHIISLKMMRLLAGNHRIHISCSKTSTSFEVNVNNPGQVIECLNKKVCAVSNAECQLDLVMSGFPKLYAGFLPRIYFPQRTVTIQSFTESSIKLRFFESAARSPYGFEYTMDKLNLFFDGLNTNQTVALQIFYCPEVIAADIDESGYGMKIRFNQQVIGENQRCDSYFDSETVQSFGNTHFCSLQGDFLQVFFGIGATFTSRLTFFNASSIQSAKTSLTFQKPERNIMILNPLQPVSLSVSIAGPNNVGFCDAAVAIHAVVSSVRPESLKFSWSSPFHDILNSNLEQIKGPSAVLYPNMFPSKDSVYKIAVSVQNYLGASGISAIHELFVEALPAPKITVIEPSNGRVFQVSEEILIAVAVTKSSCLMNGMGPLVFEWKTDALNTSEGLNARLSSCIGPMITIPSFSLQPGTSTAFELNVLTPGFRSSRTKVLITTTISQLVISVSGIQPHIGLHETIFLDGSASFDPDDPPQIKSLMKFDWSCKQGEFLCVDASNNVIQSKSGAVLSFPSYFFSANSSVTFTLTVQCKNKLALKTIDVKIGDANFYRENARLYAVGTFFDGVYEKVNLGESFKLVLETLDPMNSTSMILLPHLSHENASELPVLHSSPYLRIWNVDSSFLRVQANNRFSCTFRTETDQKTASLSLMVNTGPAEGYCRTFCDGSFEVERIRAFDEVEISCFSFSDQDLPLTYVHSYLTGHEFFEHQRGFKSAAKLPVLPGESFVWKVVVFDYFGAAGIPVNGRIAILPSELTVMTEMMAAIDSKNIGVAFAYVSSLLYSDMNSISENDTTVTKNMLPSRKHAVLCSTCYCESCEIFRMAIGLAMTMSTEFSANQVLKSLHVFNSAVSSAKVRSDLNSDTILQLIDFVSITLENMLSNSRNRHLKYQDISLISSIIGGISALITDRNFDLAFNKTAILQRAVLSKFIRQFASSLLPRIDDANIINSKMKIAISRRFQQGEQRFFIQSNSSDTLPRAILQINSSAQFDGSEIAVLLSYALVADVLPSHGAIYTTVVDVFIYRNASNIDTSSVIEFLIDEAILPVFLSDKLLTTAILKSKSKVQSWDFIQNRWLEQRSCVVSDANFQIGSVTASCLFSSASPKAISYDPEQPVCSDKVLSGSESCDDGNLEDGDGCDSECNTEPGWKCEFQPSKCKVLRKNTSVSFLMHISQCKSHNFLGCFAPIHCNGRGYCFSDDSENCVCFTGYFGSNCSQGNQCWHI
jgi:cysteine-rich repeat protein